VREYIELLLHFKGLTTRSIYGQTYICHPLRGIFMKLTGADTFRELLNDASAFHNVYRCIEQVVVDVCLSDEQRATDMEKKLATFLSLNVSSIVHCPDDFGKDEKFNVTVVYRDGGGGAEEAVLRKLCLASDNAEDEVDGGLVFHLSKRTEDSFKFALLSIEYDEKTVQVKSTPSSVPSLRLLATGFLVSKEENVLSERLIQRHLSCAAAIEIREAMSGLTNRGADLHNIYMLFKTHRILSGASKASFIKKITEISKMIHRLTEKTLEGQPASVGSVVSKVKAILASDYHQVETEVAKFRCGLWLDREKRQFICCCCTYAECDGGCIAEYLSTLSSTKALLKRITGGNEADGGGGNTINTRMPPPETPQDGEISMEEEEEEEEEEDFEPFLKLGEVRSLTQMECENEGDDDDDEDDDSSFYYFPPSGDLVTFDLLQSDFENGKEYLEKLDDPESWRLKENSDEYKIVLEYRGGEDEVAAEVEQNEDATRTVLRFSGAALQLFIDDLESCIHQIFSSKRLSAEQILRKIVLQLGNYCSCRKILPNSVGETNKTA
jgi:hypothetical protein